MSTTAQHHSGADRLRANDPERQARSAGPAQVGGVAGWVDDRTGLARASAYLLKKVFPDHWSFMLGEVAMYSMIICLLTGAFLTFWFVPSAGQVTYDGLLPPAQGRHDVRGVPLDAGHLLRHPRRPDHPPDPPLGSAAVHRRDHRAHVRVFFTGAFRKPREINWVIGSSCRMLALVEGFAGYSLPDDLLSGTGLRAIEGFMQSIPVIGSYIAVLRVRRCVPGRGDHPPPVLPCTCCCCPAILVGLFTAHIVLVVVHKHTQYPGPGRTNDNVVGFPFMPVYVAKAGGFFFIVFGVIALISALVTINPIWAYGPYDPSPGDRWVAARLVHGLRRRRPAPAARLPGVRGSSGFTFSFNVYPRRHPADPGAVRPIMAVYPFLEAWVTGDKREHHLLDRPRNAPTRTAIGAMAGHPSTLVLFFAAGNDLIAIKLWLSINDITNFFRAPSSSIPPLAFWVTKRICLTLQRHDRDLVLHGRETGRHHAHRRGPLLRAARGLDELERWKLVRHRKPRAPGARRRHRRQRRGPPHGAQASAAGPDVAASTSRTASSRSPPPSWQPAHHHGEHEAIEAAPATGAAAPETVKRAPEGD